NVYQFSGLVRVRLSVTIGNKGTFDVFGEVANDTGKLFENSIGVMLGIRKSGLLNMGKVPMKMGSWLKSVYSLGMGMLTTAIPVSSQQKDSPPPVGVVYTPSALRSLKAIEENYFFLDDEKRSGLFAYKPGVTARDDSSM